MIGSDVEVTHEFGATLTGELADLPVKRISSQQGQVPGRYERIDWGPKAAPTSTTFD